MDRAEQYAEGFVQSAAGKSEMEVSRTFEKFLALLKRRHALYLFPCIARHIERIVREREPEAVVSSRFPLDFLTRHKISRFLKQKFPDHHFEVPEAEDVSTKGEGRGKTIPMRFETKRDTLGGISIRYNDFLFDATVDEKMRKLKKEMGLKQK